MESLSQFTQAQLDAAAQMAMEIDPPPPPIDYWDHLNQMFEGFQRVIPAILREP